MYIINLALWLSIYLKKGFEEELGNAVIVNVRGRYWPLVYRSYGYTAHSSISQYGEALWQHKPDIDICSQKGTNLCLSVSSAPTFQFL